MAEEKTPVQRAMPGLLIAGSLAGVGIVMVSLLSLAPKVDDGSTPLAAESRPTPTTPTPVGVQNAGAFVLAPTVGPGGKDAPLTPARLDAPPPPPAAPLVAPIEPVTTPKKSRTTKGKTPAGKSRPRPVRIRIPKIKVNAPVGMVTTDKNGKLGVPSLNTPGRTGWYRYSPLPGEAGPSIINGHVSTRKGPAVFDRLRELARGDKIKVYRSDGKVVEFTVSGIEQASKNAFPTKRVYGNADGSELRLITCGGVFNQKAHSYTDNIVVYATLSKKAG